MRQRLILGILSAAIATSLAAASAASAATEFGDTCSGNEIAPEYTLTTLSAPAGGLPLTAPVSGVITKIKINVGESLPFSVPELVKVLRPTGGNNNFSVVSQTSVHAPTGLTVADARIPVQAGDRLGVHGEPFSYEGSSVPGLSFYCQETGGGSVLGAAMGEVGQGASAEFMSVVEGGVPITATVEPDVDGDGFGDETQDKCPQSAAVQTPCPVVTLGTSATAGKSLATVLVTSNLQASVAVAGTAKLGKGKPATLSGGTQVVAPGALAKFILVLPAKVKSKLKQLSPKQHLTVNVSATAPNVVGAPTVSSLKVKLKGQAKPKPEAKPGPKQHKKPKS